MTLMNLIRNMHHMKSTRLQCLWLKVFSVLHNEAVESSENAFKASVGNPAAPRWQAVGWRRGDLPILATYVPQRPSTPTASSPRERCWRLTCLLSAGEADVPPPQPHTLWTQSMLTNTEGMMNLSVLMCRKVTTTWQITFRRHRLTALTEDEH